MMPLGIMIGMWEIYPARSDWVAGWIESNQYAPNGLTWVDLWGLCRRLKSAKDLSKQVIGYQ